MDESAETPKEQNKRRVLEGKVQITEPLVINGRYVLDVRPSNNPNFYGLADKIVKDVSSQKPTPREIVEAANRHIPKAKDKGAYAATGEEARTKIPFPIDKFFGREIAAYCFERSLLMQVVLAYFGYETKLLNVTGVPRESVQTDHLNHAVLEIGDDLIETMSPYSEVTGSNTISSKESYIFYMGNFWKDIETQERSNSNVFTPAPK